MTNSFDPKKLRNVAGAFATGVSVITINRENGDIHGMTANSFLSVSLDPALVAFSVKKSGSLMNHLSKGKAVSISILTEDQINISNQFAGQNKSPIDIKFKVHQNAPSTIENCLAWYTTVVQEIISAGDHYLIMCQINDLKRNETDAKPLLYYSGYKSITD